MEDAPRWEIQEAEKNGGKIFIGNLRKEAEKEDLRGVFQDYGKVLSVWVAKKPHGFAFVTIQDSKDAREAAQELDKREFQFAEPGGIRVEISTNLGGRRNKGRGRDDRESSRGRYRYDRSRGDRSRDRGRGRSPSRSPSKGRRRDSRQRRKF